MPSVIRARHAGPGFSRWGRRYHGPHWYVRLMTRAITEGWELSPEKRADVVETLYQVTRGKPPEGVDRLTVADVIAASRALQKGTEMALAEARLNQDAEQPPTTNIHVSVASQQNLVDAAEILKRLGLARTADTVLPAHADAPPIGVPADG